MKRKRHILILLNLYCISIIEAAIHTGSNVINDNDRCVPGQVYKKECNSCHCVLGLHLVCTKMPCLRPSDIPTPNSRCNPGSFYVQRCRRCFCSEDKRLLCGTEDCKTVGKLPMTHDAIHAYSKYTPSEQHKLPALKHQGSECVPGSSYRVDCNSCLCLSNGNLLCEKRLCPSHDDVHRVKAKSMSGGPCDSRLSQVECVLCKCIDGTKTCRATPNCLPTKKHETIEENSASKCTPGMIYRQVCNKCVCLEDRSLQCTMKTCLSKTQANRFQWPQKVRKHWVDYTLRRSTSETES